MKNINAEKVWNSITPEFENVILGDSLTFILQRLFYCWQVYLRPSEIRT